jgi:DNA helicase II / ATP-dependent DNA helicase PcrA
MPYHFISKMLLVLLSARRCTSFTVLYRDMIVMRSITSSNNIRSRLFSSSNYLQDLNDAQKDAVTQPTQGITRVVAGPGAGKTRVLTCRIAHLLEHDNYGKILAVTFTKKAASEMQHRLNKLLTQPNDLMDDPSLVSSGMVDEMVLGKPSGLERVTLGTFHSVCARILRNNGNELATLPSVSPLAANLDSSFSIMDQADQTRIVKDALQNAGLKNLDKKNGVRMSSILSAIARLKTTTPEVKEIKKNPALSIAHQIYPRYREHLFTNNALDFDDLIILTVELLQANANVRDMLRRRWSHMLVDEFQDTSETQLELVKLMMSKSLLVVGDADQSIYSWRGAHVESMADFGTIFSNVNTVYLMENYRSTQNIVAAAQKVISASESLSASNLRQKMKAMRGVGPTPRILACANGKAEANYVVKTILQMVEEEEIHPRDSVAILYRTNAQSRALEEACVQNKLLYSVRGTGAFYSRAEIKDCLCFIRWIYNGRDQSAMIRAFKTPSKGLGEKSLKAFEEYCRAVEERYADESILERPTPLDLLISLENSHNEVTKELPNAMDFFSKRTLNSLKLFATQMKSLRSMAHQKSISELIKGAFDIFALEDHFNAISDTDIEFSDRLNNYGELRQAAEQYSTLGFALSQIEEENGGSQSPLMNFLDDISLMTEEAQENDDANNKDKAIKANLMTIHSAKGMEFDIVFIVGNEEGTFPTMQAVGKGDGSIELDEERRLCYVAMTRAKNRLIMTWRRESSFFQGDVMRNKQMDRSRFMDVMISKGSELHPSTSKAPTGFDTSNKFTTVSRIDRNLASRTEARENTPPAQQHNTALSGSNLSKLSEKFDAHLGQQTKNTDEASSIDAIKSILKQKQLNKVSWSQRKSDAIKRNQMSKKNPRDNTSKRNQNQKLDSTWFFPIGSSVKHFKYGQGKVLPPPPDQDGEMMVKVKFQEGMELILPAMTKDLFPN